jgi:glutamate racemase
LLYFELKPFLTFAAMQKPIGIFDSGVGGLTVAAAIKEVLPQESFIYYGDTRHAPYGDKSAETLTEYATRITQFLVNQNCKAVVIACNSASALAYAHLQKSFAGVPLLNVIDPVVEQVAKKKYQKVGVIATRATTQSGVYAARLKALQPALEVYLKATPLLAPLVEEGLTRSAVSNALLAHYLGDPQLAKPDALILGCTHYPLLQAEIKDYYKKEVEIINSSTWVAQRLKKILLDKNLLAPAKAAGHYQFYVSEKTEAFTAVGQLFFGQQISLHEKRLIS